MLELVRQEGAFDSHVGRYLGGAVRGRGLETLCKESQGVSGLATLDWRETPSPGILAAGTNV